MPSSGTDYPDFTDRYNTTLKDENSYSAWVSDQSVATGRDVSKDTYDYDLKGWFQENGAQDLSDAHLTDKYKKPNHPTFSDQSIYHGVDGYEGGQWARQPGTLDQYSFTPGASNFMSGEGLQDYFKRVEPQNTLILPGS